MGQMDLENILSIMKDKKIDEKVPNRKRKSQKYSNYNIDEMERQFTKITQKKKI
jgi:spore coat protein CotF